MMFQKLGETNLFNVRSFPLISIIFTNYNGGIQPLECLMSIYQLDYPKENIEVIIVDNNSTDESLGKIKNHRLKFKKKGLKIIIIKNKENVGFAKAINIGIEKSLGDFIFIGNDDIIFKKNSLKNMLEYLIHHSEVGVVGGRIYLKNEPKKIISAGYMMNQWTGNIHSSSMSNTVHEPDWVQGCAMLVPRRVFDTVGLFDPQFFLFFEDFDFCLRAKKAGYKIVYFPNAEFIHGSSVTMDKNKNNKYYQWYKNKIRFCIKNLPLVNLVSILIIQIFLITPYRALVLRDGRLFPFLKGMYWNVTNILQTSSQRKL